jgi:hypothetical protein
MSGGGSSKQKTPESTKIQAKQGIDRWNERIEDGYQDLEKAAMKDADGSLEPLLAAKGNADLAQSAESLYQPSLNGPSAMQLASDGSVHGKALSEMKAGVRSQALEINDIKRLNVMKTGQDIASDNTAALSSMTGRATQKALSTLRNKQTVNQARTAAMAKVAINGYLGMKAKKEWENKEVDGVKVNAGKDWRSEGGAWRFIS